MSGGGESGLNSILQSKLKSKIKSIELKMKKQYFISLLVIFAFASCTHETRITDSTYPDGSPKRECVYSAKEAPRELLRETTFYPHKKIQMTGEYKNKKRDGRWVYYYENGNIWSEGFFKNGKSDGKRITHYENGKVFYVGYYDQDKRVGVWTFYDENGKFLKSVDYTKASKK